MHPTARKCIGWAIGLFVIGAAAEVFIPRIYSAIGNALGSSLGAVSDAVDFTLTFVRWTAMPVGASLIGAAIVINTIIGGRARYTDEVDLHNNNERR